MVALGEQPTNDTTGAIVGVGDEIERFSYSQRIDQQDHLVQQGSLIAIAKDDALMDTTGQGYSEYGQQGLCQNGNGLTGMAEATPVK